jgi:hypothetical protein
MGKAVRAIDPCRSNWCNADTMKSNIYTCNRNMRHTEGVFSTLILSYFTETSFVSFHWTRRKRDERCVSSFSMYKNCSKIMLNKCCSLDSDELPSIRFIDEDPHCFG